MAGSLFENLHNFASIRLKKYMYEILKERYPKHEQLLERLGHNLPLDQDVTAFSQLVVEVYELGYLKAVKDYENELNRLGYNVKITAPERPKEASTIFK